MQDNIRKIVSFKVILRKALSNCAKIFKDSTRIPEIFEKFLAVVVFLNVIFVHFFRFNATLGSFFRILFALKNGAINESSISTTAVNTLLFFSIKPKGIMLGRNLRFGPNVSSWLYDAMQRKINYFSIKRLGTLCARFK